MYVDFDKLREIATQFQEAYKADGGFEAYKAGRHVYSIEFKPEDANVRVHMSWPMFKQLVADISPMACVPEITVVDDKTIHCFFRMYEVDCVCCLNLWDIKQEFQLIGLPDEDHTTNFEDDLLSLFNMWQNITGWGLIT